MPPDEENLFDQAYIPYARINSDVVHIPRIYIDQDYLENMYRIYARDGYGREMRTEIIYLSDTTPCITTRTRGLSIFMETCVDAVNQVLSYAIEHYIVDHHTLGGMFSQIGSLTADAIACLVEYTARVVQEYELARRAQSDAMADTAQRVLTWGFDPMQDLHTQELIDRVREMQVEITPIPLLNANLVESELIPFSDEDLDTLLFEGA